MFRTPILRASASQSVYSAMSKTSTVDNSTRFVKMADREDRTDLPLPIAAKILDAQDFSMWKGSSMLKCAFDFKIYPLLLQELKPKTVIETGAFCGASAVWMNDMLVANNGPNWGKLFSSDITLQNIPQKLLNHDNIEFVESSSRNLVETLTDERLKSLPHPWLWVEDAHYEFEEILNNLHPYFQPGDYIVVEDTNEIMHKIWQDPMRNVALGREDQMDENLLCEKKRFILRDFCLKHPEYRVDTHYQDMFGYNVGKNQNSIIKLVE